jgi:uncharacterized protein involved in outer membrane biogenesis
MLERIKRIFTRKRIKRLLIAAITIPILLGSVLVAIVYWKQDAIVKELLDHANADFKGRLEIKDSHISPFANFPYISIDLEHVRIFESKDKNAEEIFHLKDTYIGFNLWSILNGKFKIKKIRLSDGTIKLVQHKDGTMNILNALETEKEIEDAEEEFHLDLKKIQLDRIDVSKYNEENGITIDANISKAKANFSSDERDIETSLDLHVTINILKNGDTTFFKHKHIDFETDLRYLKEQEKLVLEPTEVEFEGASFGMDGSVNFKKDLFVDLNFDGKKPNFDLLIAFAPEELIPTLRSYENQGQVFFKAKVKGRSINGHQPDVRVDFGCKNGFFKNKIAKRSLNNLFFSGYFTNGKKRTVETMEFRIQNFKATPEMGRFKVDLAVVNFKAPEISLKVDSDLELSYLRDFLDLTSIKKAKGRVQFKMDFHDIIDTSDPSKTLERFNESYKMSMSCQNVSLESEDLPFPIAAFNMSARVDGHKVILSRFDLKTKQSDLSISGQISDLPAIIHHTDKELIADLHIKSNAVHTSDFSEDKTTDETISKLRLDLLFKTTAKNLTEFKTLPNGEFLLENFNARLKHYPHTFHDFHADIFVHDDDIQVDHIRGYLDKSDFHFSGFLDNLPLLFEEKPKGDVIIDYNFSSNQLQLHDLMTYRGEHFLPKEYRNEEFDHLKVHGKTLLHFNKTLSSTDTYFDHLSADMKVHPIHLQSIKGRVHTEKDHIVLDDLSGKIGNSDFHTTLHYYYGKKAGKSKRQNKLYFKSNFLDIDQLITYVPEEESSQPKTSQTKSKTTSANKQTSHHDAGFNVYTLPFSNMTIDVHIRKMNYHKYKISNIHGQLRTTENHYIHVDKLQMDLAGGHFDIKGYFNGSNPDLIYFHPNIKIKNVDLDQLMFKFDNFGQDYIVSNNLHGRFSGTITGKIHMHNDLVPKIDDSVIHMDVDVIDGKLENYSVFEYMSDYFKDKNLSKVLFDTLQNHIDLKNGIMTIPKMTINSTLGHLEVWGEQDMNSNMEYYLRIPFKMITGAAKSKLFGRNDEVSPDQIDEIEYGSDKMAYVTVKITGTADDYKFTLSKDKKKGR